MCLHHILIAESAKTTNIHLFSWVYNINISRENWAPTQSQLEKNYESQLFFLEPPFIKCAGEMTKPLMIL